MIKSLKISPYYLLLALVNLAQQELEYLPGQLLGLVKQSLDVRVGFLLVGLKLSPQVEVVVQLLDGLNAPVFVLSIVRLNHSPLSLAALTECGHHHPAALGVLDVRADLADDLRGAIAVQEVVLDLEVLSHDA